ncbi:hypothetical protein N7449_004753 [Penicillium cf. viridicatum]|uniref:DUF7770 domain-containing protein n=1 Tax=Penicillium cf. viridicatum TaxID=2972119 RepID=A0A9W9MJZ9_9EURO|nr:hypothetical protein N7449_004753 [Penicillium cf. viridicatum]
MLITDYMTNRILNPEWDPIEFQPRGEWLEILRQPVECIRAVCLSPPDHFHPNIWAFFLSTSEEDMTAISVLVPRGVEATFVLSVNPGFTVGDIYSKIVTNNRHKYEIDEEGWNSRTWVYDQIDLFNQHGIFANQDEVELVNDGLQKRWPGGLLTRSRKGLTMGKIR